MELLIKCGFCAKQMEDPMSLPCGHIFCKSCIVSNEIKGQLICSSCKSQSNGKSQAKESKLTEFLIRYHQDEYENIEVSQVDETEIEGRCEICPAPPAPKKPSPGELELPPPDLPKLKKCFHCKKNLCASCRNKHYSETRLDIIKLLGDYKNSSSSLIVTSEKINDNRQKNVLEYKMYIEAIKKRKADLTKMLESEEKNLLLQVEKGIAEKTEQSEGTKNDVEKFSQSKKTTDQLKDKFTHEKNDKRLCVMYFDLQKAKPEWDQQMKTHADRTDPSKEMKIVYEETKLKDSIIGTINAKKDKTGIDKAEVNGKSKICTIL